MIKKLTKHGNSYALVIDKPTLELLGIDPERTPLSVVTDGKALLVKPARQGKLPKSFYEALDEINAEWGPALKRLAE